MLLIMNSLFYANFAAANTVNESMKDSSYANLYEICKVARIE